VHSSPVKTTRGTMRVVYKTNIVDAIIEEIRKAKERNEKIDRFELTRDEIDELQSRLSIDLHHFTNEDKFLLYGVPIVVVEEEEKPASATVKLVNEDKPFLTVDEFVEMMKDAL